MKSLLDNVLRLAAIVLVGCGSDRQGSASDAAAGTLDSNGSDAPASSSIEGSTDDVVADAGGADTGAEDAPVVVRDAGGDAVTARVDAGDGAVPADAAGGGIDAASAADAAHGAACQHASDCRLVSFECTRCDCLALGTADPDPVCHGNPVQCFQDPCQGQVAACASGHCAAQ